MLKEFRDNCDSDTGGYQPGDDGIVLNFVKNMAARISLGKKAVDLVADPAFLS